MTPDRVGQPTDRAPCCLSFVVYRAMALVLRAVRIGRGFGHPREFGLAKTASFPGPLAAVEWRQRLLLAFFDATNIVAVRDHPTMGKAGFHPILCPRTDPFPSPRQPQSRRGPRLRPNPPRSPTPWNRCLTPIHDSPRREPQHDTPPNPHDTETPCSPTAPAPPPAAWP